MNDSFGQKILAKIGIAILVIALVDLVYLNWWLIQSQKTKDEIKTQNDSRSLEFQQTTVPENLPTPTPSPSPQTTGDENQKTSQKSDSFQNQTTSNPTGGTTTIIQTAYREIFIPLGSGSTKSAKFIDLAGMEVTIDTTKYSVIDSVVFEASLWTDGGNGMAWGMLKNSTDNNPLIESRIAGVSGTGVVKTSGSIPIPSGSKKYIVQGKTDLENFAAHVENARIKITLK